MAEVRVKTAFVNKAIGSPVFKLNVAESHSKKNDQGGWDVTGRTHFDLIASRDSGVDLGNFVEGDRIAFQGTQFTDVREYQGKKYYTLTVWVDRIELLDRRGQQAAPAQSGWGGQEQQAAQNSDWNVPGEVPAASTDAFDENIEAPF